MKVLNLQCGLHHSFEGWFASEADYADQQERRLLTCPLCGDASIHKLLSAPAPQPQRWARADGFGFCASA